MSKILKLAKEHYDYNDSFCAYDLASKINMDSKVIAMNLKKLRISEKVGSFIASNGECLYYIRTDENILKAKKEVNDIIDKYDLKQKKFDI